MKNLDADDAIKDEIMAKRFTSTRFAKGYDVEQVDGFLDDVATGRVNPIAVRAKSFRAVRFKEGYDCGQVDDFLDHLANEMDGIEE
jgi:DivIVA domain-containing protein